MNFKTILILKLFFCCSNYIKHILYVPSPAPFLNKKTRNYSILLYGPKPQKNIEYFIMDWYYILYTI